MLEKWWKRVAVFPQKLNIELYFSRRKLFKMTPVHVLFCPQPKDFRFPEKESNQEKLTLNKLKSEFFFLPFLYQ